MKLLKKLLASTLFWTLAFNPLIVSAYGQTGMLTDDVAFIVHAETLEDGEVLVWKREVPMAEILAAKEFDEEKEFGVNEYLEVRNEMFAEIINDFRDYFRGNPAVITPKNIVSFFEKMGYTLTVIQDDDSWYYSPENYNYASVISDLNFEGNMNIIWGLGKLVRKTITNAALDHALPFFPRIPIGPSSSEIMAEGRRYKKMANLLEQNEKLQKELKTLLNSTLHQWRWQNDIDDEANVFAPMLSR